jgi:hypothetical protein
VGFESAYYGPLHCCSVPWLTVSRARRLRWWSIFHHYAGANTNAHARAGSLANTDAVANADTITNANSQSYSDAISAFGCAFVVTELVVWCGKLQRLPVNCIIRALHENWQLYGHELHRFICEAWPNLFLLRDRSR